MNNVVKTILYLSKVGKPFLLRTTVYPPFVNEYQPFDNKHVLEDYARVHPSTTKEYIRDLFRNIEIPPYVHVYY